MPKLKIPSWAFIALALVVLLAYPWIQKSQYSQHIMVMTFMVCTVSATFTLLSANQK